MSTTTSNKPADESIVQHATRSTKNGFFACFGFTKKSGDLAKIKYKETQISSRQKTFGTEYFALLEKDAAETELKACVEKAQADIKVIEGEIKALEEKIANIDKETEAKIAAPPTASQTAAATSATDSSKPTSTLEPKVEAPVPAPAAAPADSAAGAS